MPLGKHALEQPRLTWASERTTVAEKAAHHQGRSRRACCSRLLTRAQPALASTPPLEAPTVPAALPGDPALVLASFTYGLQEVGRSLVRAYQPGGRRLRRGSFLRRGQAAQRW